MFLPLYDIAPMRHLKAPHVTRVLLAATVVGFVVPWSDLLPGGTLQAAVMGGLFPAVLFGTAVLPPEVHAIPAPLTLVTSLFLHGSWLHLVGNMLFLQVFGDNVEDAMGHARFLLFYLACGVAAGLAHAFALPGSEQPLVGASGAVAGVIGAYLVLHPRALVWGLALNLIPVRISAAWALSAWVAVQVWHAWQGDDAATAWWAHLGGFVTGLALVQLLRRRPIEGAAPGS